MLRKIRERISQEIKTYRELKAAQDELYCTLRERLRG